MAEQILYPAQANLKMALWQADADSIGSNELYVWFSDSGLPNEVIIRLHQLISYTKKVGNKVFSIGKIIIIKLIEFIKAHPSLVIGAAIGIGVASLITSVPFFGQLLAPVAAALGITITMLGAVAGHRVDKRNQGQEVQDGIVGIAENVVEIASIFFKLIADVFNLVFQNVITA